MYKLDKHFAVKRRANIQRKNVLHFTYIVIGLGIKNDRKCIVLLNTRRKFRLCREKRLENLYDQELPQSHTADQPAAT